MIRRYPKAQCIGIRVGTLMEVLIWRRGAMQVSTRNHVWNWPS